MSIALGRKSQEETGRPSRVGSRQAGQSDRLPDKHSTTGQAQTITDAQTMSALGGQPSSLSIQYPGLVPGVHRPQRVERISKKGFFLFEAVGGKGSVEELDLSPSRLNAIFTVLACAGVPDAIAILRGRRKEHPCCRKMYPVNDDTQCILDAMSQRGRRQENR